ncbi:hypothetical protein EI021_30905, partial [Escherichia coli]|nr:hypothetical protein [Escherichia coli]
MSLIVSRKFLNYIKILAFDSGEEIEIVRLDFRKFQFLYKDGDEFVLMDLETFDQIHVPSELVGDNALFMKEN